MLVAHATWHGGALCLWAEDTGLPHVPPQHPGDALDADGPAGDGARPARAGTAKRRQARGTAAKHTSHPGEGRVRGVPVHPFATADFAATSYAPLVRAAARAELTLLLPGTTDGPLPSPEAARAPHAATPVAREWRVPALVLDPLAAMALLRSAGEAADVVPGAGLRFLFHLAEEALSLAGQGRVLPALVREDGDLTARWRPVIVGDDAERFRLLARAMPPAFRAAAGDMPASGLLLAALTGLVDTAVRGTVPHPLLPERRGRVPDRLPLAERWVAALTGPDPAVSREPGDDPESLVRELDSWASAARRPAGPMRVCFRLAEPPEDEPDAPWTVQFALQGTEDPSLRVPAAALWTGEAESIADAQETLLTGLGRALRLYPEVAEELRTATPTCVRTDAAGAFRFLREAAPLLSAAGFGVLLPQWAGRARLGMKLTTRSKSAPSGAVVSSGFGLESMLDFRWDLALDGAEITEEELAELARLKAPLVRLRGQWVELDERQLASALKFLEQRRTGEMSAAQAISAAIHAGDDALPLTEVDADGVLGDLLSGRADRRLEPIPTPEAFEGRLRPYQERGLAWLAFLDGLGLGAVLADDMGLGKTLETLALLVERRAGPTLLVCPMSLVGNWQREAARFTPKLRLYVHHGTGRHRGEDLERAVREADLVLTTYGTAARDRDALAAVAWARVVCDEAQALKNSGTRQARAVRSIPAGSRIALTGTPVENHLTELWSIMEFANPGLLGPRTSFRERFATPIEAHGDERAAATLKRATGPFILRRVKTDKTIIADLPEKQQIKVWCNLTREQASLYQATVEDMLDRIAGSEGIERRGLVLATMARLRQVCNHPAHLLKDGSKLAGRSGKLERLEEICAEVTEHGEKALVFTQYAEFGAMLQPHLEALLDRPVLWLHGGTGRNRRDELVRRFQESDEPAVFLLSLKAAGTGLTLTAANHVVHVDRWWNPAVEDQATDRAFRIGQTKNVQVRTFVCVGTLEDRIDEMIDRKRALAEAIIGTGEEWLTELSVDELRDVIKLSPEAVSD